MTTDAERIANLEADNAKLKDDIAKLEYFQKRMKEARANAPDWEQLWSEQTERAEKAERERDALRVALKGTLLLIRRAQGCLSVHLQPDSCGDDAECLNELLEMFDGPHQRAIESVARKALENQP